MRSWLAGLCILSVIGCGAKKPVVPQPPDLSGLEKADALVLQGCYDCLLDAQGTYRRIGRGAGRPLVLNRLFETSVLIGLRHKELALDPSEPFAEARSVAKELAPDLEAERYLTLAEAVPPDDVGTPRKTMSALRDVQLRAGFVPKIETELAWLRGAALSEPFRKYLDLSVDCAYPSRPRPQNAPPPARAARQPAEGAPQLIVYRTGICAPINQPVLYRLRQADPRFVEVSMTLARIDIALADQMGPGQAQPRLEEARLRFPASPAVNYLSGSFNQAIGDCDAALAFYNETLSITPIHEDALLGRTICQTYLKQYDDGIQTATRMIDLKTDNIGEAYYWRAFNQHVKKVLDLARIDIELAKRAAGTDKAYTLAGIIKYDQDDLDPSERDLETARAMPQGENNCTAIWYLGMVQTKRKGWPAAAEDFEAAMNCYGRAVGVLKGELRGFEMRMDLDATFKARKIAALQEGIAESTSQRYASAMNAANYYATASNIAAAKRLVEIAAEDPKLADPVGKLREWLKDKR
jgi:tetratricopeptide (TPR) repeat protein